MTITDTTIPTGTRHAFWIDESRRPGPRGHIPSVVFEGVSGHYPPPDGLPLVGGGA